LIFNGNRRSFYRESTLLFCSSIINLSGLNLVLWFSVCRPVLAPAAKNLFQLRVPDAIEVAPYISPLHTPLRNDYAMLASGRWLTFAGWEWLPTGYQLYLSSRYGSINPDTPGFACRDVLIRGLEFLGCGQGLRYRRIKKRSPCLKEGGEASRGSRGKPSYCHNQDTRRSPARQYCHIFKNKRKLSSCFLDMLIYCGKYILLGRKKPLLEGGPRTRTSGEPQYYYATAKENTWVISRANGRPPKHTMRPQLPFAASSPS